MFGRLSRPAHESTTNALAPESGQSFLREYILQYILLNTVTKYSMTQRTDDVIESFSLYYIFSVFPNFVYYYAVAFVT